MNRLRFTLASVPFAAIAILFGSACVDLFHTTDFQICPRDPEAGTCLVDAASADAGPDADTDAADASTYIWDLCQQTKDEARANAERVCVLQQACEGAASNETLGNCIAAAQSSFDCAISPGANARGPRLDYWRCVANAHTCADLDTCIFHGSPPTCTTGPNGKAAFTQCVRELGRPASAPATVYVECVEDGKRPRVARSCAATGQRCSVGPDGTAQCTGKFGTSGCPASEGCQGTDVVWCNDGDPVDHGTDCTQLGAGTCEVTDFAPLCRPSDPCTVKKVSCDGAIAHVTCSDDRTIDYDCSAFDRVCDKDARTAVELNLGLVCTTKATRCTTSGTPDTCVNGAVETCVAGVKRTIACADFDAGPCTDANPSCSPR